MIIEQYALKQLYYIDLYMSDFKAIVKDVRKNEHIKAEIELKKKDGDII